MSYEVSLLPAQKKFLEVPRDGRTIDIAVYQWLGGYGSGKTWSGSLLGIILALKYPGIRGLVGAYTFTLVRDTTLQTYFEHLDALGIEYTYSKSEFNITFSNGSVIMFRHFDEPNALKSFNVGFIEIEEMSDVPESTFRMLISRLRQYGTNKMPEGFVYRLFGHTNPQPDRGWIYENFKVNPIKNSRRIIAPTTDNKYLPKDYLSLLRDVYKDDDYFNLYVLGQDSNYFGNLVTKNFDKDQQIKSNLQINPKELRSLYRSIELLLREHRTMEAIAYTKVVLAADADPQTLTNLGSMLSQESLFDIAREAFQSALKVGPDFVPAYIESGKMLGNLNRFDDAIHFWSMALEIDPKNQEAMNLIAQARTLAHH